ncbi:phage tail spike protein [Clostridium lacusfryxellense]|uniref:phage tail spike protein n=1 Tax=Clostridium lacusfryxellense TaxID=205328 RepID=UPI001C0D920A|nr:phage tail spike protein [Clostridium lacusfryxellense]MBU3112009.1 phage tail protein [Clostridium lacusfryxellense]
MKKQIKVAYFPSTATKNKVLSSNGKSLDKYCIKCSTEEDLSTGNYILDATFLIEDNLQDLLQEEVILKVLMDYGEEIFRISKPTVGTRYIDIVARQITIAEELTLWLEDVRPTTMSGANTSNYLVSNSIGIKEIQVVSNISNFSTAYYQKMTLYQALHDCDQSFLNRWGGEIQRRGYIEYINSVIGISRGGSIREGKNLTGFECTSNIDNLITRAQGKGSDDIVGHYIDSPLINSYNRVYTDVIEYSDVKVKGENSEEGYATLALAQVELDRRIRAEYDTNGIDKIKASYAINFVQLEKTEEYKNYIQAERVYLGDIIGVYVPRLNSDVKVRAMIKKFDILAQKTIEITLSNYIEVKPLSIKQIIERLDEIGTKDDILQLAKDNATVLIKAGIKNSYVTVRENEIIIGDTKDINTMTKVWRWNSGGLGYSSTGYYGEFGIAMTNDGAIVADFITTGVLNANLIKTGIITSKNGNWKLNLDAETFNLGNKLSYADGVLAIDTNLIVSTVRGSTSYINDLGQKVTANQASTIAQNPDNVEIGFNGINDNFSFSTGGMRCNHVDGSYTVISSQGLTRYVSATGQSYHYLKFSGSISKVLSGSTYRVYLPEEFRGKNYLLDWWAGNTFPQHPTDLVFSSNVNLISEDKNAASFVVEASLMVRNPATEGAPAWRGEMNILYTVIY